MALLLAALPAGTADPPKDSPPKIDLDLIPDPDVAWLKREKVPTDDAGLLAFLRSCQGKDIPPAEIDALISKLRTGTKDEQVEAARKLTEIGTIAVPALRKHRTGADGDAAKRVRDCLEKIEEAGDKLLARPAMRRLLVRRPAGTAEALLGYLPFASDPAAEEDIYYGLDGLVARDWKTVAVIARGLKDPQPARRALAACILGRRGYADQKQVVRELLKDADSNVRLRAAQGLLAGRDKSGMPTLIDLLDDPSIEIRWQAEELLRWTAIDTAPAAMASEPEAKRGSRAAWRQWWKDHGEKLDLAEVEKEPRRPLLLLGYNRAEGRVWIFGCDGETRHEWKTKKGLEDAQYVPGGTVLTLHEQPVREKPLLAERDRGGKVLWEYEDMRDPASIQRLANGQVFVAERQSVEPKLWYQLVGSPGMNVGGRPADLSALPYATALRQLADRRILCARIPDSAGKKYIAGLFELDAKANSFRHIGHKATLNLIDRIQVEETADGYLFSHLRNEARYRDKGIIEVAWDGYELWGYRLAGTTHAARLCGGNTIACIANRLIEISPDKRTISDVPCDQVLGVARPCLELIRVGFETRPGDLDLSLSADQWARRLKSPRARMRQFALDRLVDLGPVATSVIASIRSAAADPDAAVREAAVRALAAAGADAVPGALEDVKHPNSERRYKAVEVIGRYGRYPGAVEALIAATRDGDRKVRLRALDMLNAKVEDVQVRTTYDMWPSRWLWAADRVVPVVVAATRDQDSDVRGRAYMALATLGPAAKSAVPHLLGAWKDADVDDRCRIASALGNIGPVSDEILALLSRTLAHTNEPQLKSSVARALGHIGPPAKASVDTLIELFRDPGTADVRWSSAVRDACVVSLARIAPDDPRVIALFVATLTDEKVPPGPRGTVEAMLPKMGPAAAVAALPVLNRLGGADPLKPNEFFDTAQRIRHNLRSNR